MMQPATLPTAPTKLPNETPADFRSRLRAFNLDTANCRECATGSPFNSHMGSGRCRSNSLASGGTKPHCTCGTCY